MIQIYVDGSSTGRSNREWGWGVLVIFNKRVIGYGYGGGPSGTNNWAELEAIFQALIYAKTNKINNFKIFTDSQYAQSMINETKFPQKNIDKVNKIIALRKEFKVEIEWVRGHNGNQFNEAVDKLAKKGKNEHAKP